MSMRYSAGELPAKPSGLNAQEARYYSWLREAMNLVGVGGRVDQLLLQMTARQLARADELRGAMVERAILDKEVVVGFGSQVGWGDDYTPNHLDPQVLNTGITLVGKRAVLPSGLRVGRNCKIGPNIRPSDFEGPMVPSGGTVEAPSPGRPPF